MSRRSLCLGRLVEDAEQLSLRCGDDDLVDTAAGHAVKQRGEGLVGPYGRGSRFHHLFYRGCVSGVEPAGMDAAEHDLVVVSDHEAARFPRASCTPSVWHLAEAEGDLVDVSSNC